MCIACMDLNLGIVRHVHALKLEVVTMQKKIVTFSLGMT